MRRNSKNARTLALAIKKSRKKQKRQIAQANMLKHAKKFLPADERIRTAIRYKSKLWGKDRKKTFREVYKPQPYSEPPNTQSVSGDLGIESNIVNFLDFAEECIDCRSSHLRIDLKSATRVWPSAITMFASMVHWFSLTSSKHSEAVISANRSNAPNVNQYLSDSGFHEYVSATTTSVPSPPSAKTLKIQRERSLDFIPKLKELRNLIKNHSSFNSDEEEEFACVVLSEIFINVTEHGVYDESFGWFALAQMHNNSGFISLCIADNGIGIKNSLITGPQRQVLINSLGNKIKDEDLYILEALKENVSGAYSAVDRVKGRFNQSQVPKGAQRGRGLFLITDTCKALGVKFSLLSHRGCVSFDAKGSMQYASGREDRVFAGTLYHLMIPAKRTNE